MQCLPHAFGGLPHTLFPVTTQSFPFHESRLNCHYQDEPCAFPTTAYGAHPQAFMQHICGYGMCLGKGRALRWQPWPCKCPIGHGNKSNMCTNYIDMLYAGSPVEHVYGLPQSHATNTVGRGLPLQFCSRCSHICYFQVGHVNRALAIPPLNRRFRVNTVEELQT